MSDAVSWYKSQTGISKLTDFDKDNDGYLDGVMLIYAAPDSRAYDLDDANENMWAYCFWTQVGASKTNPTPNAFFWASYDFMYSSGLKAQNRTGKSSYGSGDTSHCTIDAHTFIHEMGHIFGLVDYYDYSKAATPAGCFSMQDYNIGAHDPFSRFALGWVKPYIPSETCTFQIRNIESSGELVLLHPNPNSYNGTPFDEYILLELFTPTDLNAFDCTYDYGGYEKGPQVYGVRVWHVDARLFSYTLSRLTTNPRDGEVYHATSNTATGDHSTNLSGNSNNRMLHLIRNNTNTTYFADDIVSVATLFRSGSSFSFSKFSSQFLKSTLNNGSTLGWEVSFTQVANNGMQITCTRI